MVRVKPTLRTLLRCCLALSLVTGGLAITTPDAQAQNWGVAAPAKKSEADIEKDEEKVRQEAADKRAAKEKEEAERAEAEPEAAAAEPEPTPAPAVTTTKLKAARRQYTDAVVPGCAPGMLCTVCVAGCGKNSAAIVHAGRNPARKE